MVWLYFAQSGRCIHCLKPMKRHSRWPHGVSLEHLKPRNGRGSNKSYIPSNTLLAHQICNTKRDRRPIDPELIDLAQRLWSIYERARAYGKYRPNRDLSQGRNNSLDIPPGL